MMFVLFIVTLVAGSIDLDETEPSLFGSSPTPVEEPKLEGPELHATSQMLMLPTNVIFDFMALEKAVAKFEENLENKNSGNLLTFKTLRRDWQKIEDAFIAQFKATPASKTGPFFPQMTMLDALEVRIYAIEKALLTRPV
jgi:hypothetical protein